MKPPISRWVGLLVVLAVVLGGGLRWDALTRAASPAGALPLAAGRTLYVDPNGSDTSGTGSSNAPWKTIQRAADAVQAGDLVLINPGTYAGGVTIAIGGTSSAPITFRGNGSGVVVQGSSSERDALFVTYADWIVIESLTVRNATRAGLRIDASHHVTVRNSVFGDNGTWGVFTDFSDYTLIEYSELYGSVAEHGIYISNSSDYPTIRGNRIHHNRSNGLHMNGDLSMGGDGIISGGLVENNIIWENGLGGGAGVNMDGVTDTIVRNNLIYDNHAGGIAVYQIDGGVCSRDNRLLNNTIVLASDGRWAVNIYAGCTGNKVFNNILYTAHSWRGSIVLGAASIAGFESDYNVVMDRFSTDDGDSRLDLAAWRALGHDQHSRIATPAELFANVGGKDFHLRIGSPAIDAGTTLPDVVTDLDGNSRPRGSAFDAGAYESGSSGTSPTATPVPPTPTAIPPTATTVPTTGWTPFADGFESGNLSAWTKTTGLVVQQTQVAGGAWAVRGTSTRPAAYASRTFSKPQQELWFRVRVAVLGSTPSIVTLLEARTKGNVGLVAVIRQADGRLAVVATGTGVTRSAGPLLAQGSGWHEIVLRVRTGSGSLVDVWVDGAAAAELSGPMTLASTDKIGRCLIGESTKNRTFDLGFDDLAVDVVSPASLGAVGPSAAVAVEANEPAATTATPTATAELPATATITPAPPTATPAPTATLEPPAPTATPELPTLTPEPPTPTSAPPPPTDTPVPLDPTPTDQAGA